MKTIQHILFALFAFTFMLLTIAGCNNISSNPFLMLSGGIPLFLNTNSISKGTLLLVTNYTSSWAINIYTNYNGSIAYDGTYVYFTRGNGIVKANLSTGVPVWSNVYTNTAVTISNNPSYSPVSGGTVYVTGIAYTNNSLIVLMNDAKTNFYSIRASDGVCAVSPTARFSFYAYGASTSPQGYWLLYSSDNSFKPGNGSFGYSVNGGAAEIDSYGNLRRYISTPIAAIVHKGDYVYAIQPDLNYGIYSSYSSSGDVVYYKLYKINIRTGVYEKEFVFPIMFPIYQPYAMSSSMGLAIKGDNYLVSYSTVVQGSATNKLALYEFKE